MKYTQTEIQKALKIKEALIVLADLTGLDYLQLVSRICFHEKNMQAKFIDASDKWNAFEEADIVERGKMLGLKIEMCDDQSA